MKTIVLACTLTAALGGYLPQRAHAAGSDRLAVEISNQSEPVLCAEKDNVTLSFASSRVRSFRIEAAHPVYLTSTLHGSSEPDWTACDMSADPVHAAARPPRKTTLYEQPDLWVVGWVFPTFWRPSTTPVRIGDRVEQGLHMLQVWLLRSDGAEEVLVLYPQDGNWRARPLARRPLRYTPYGSSFLIGPIEIDQRPVVNIEEVRFDPATRTFTLSFKRGGTATLKLARADENRLRLDVAFDRAVGPGPFAMLRSMYVTEFNNDVARIAVREEGAKGWHEYNVMKFQRALASDLWAGRLAPSQHNTSSPDLVFHGFSEGPTPRLPENKAPPLPMKPR